jgi:hypothetical protein
MPDGPLAQAAGEPRLPDLTTAGDDGVAGVARSTIDGSLLRSHAWIMAPSASPPRIRARMAKSVTRPAGHTATTSSVMHEFGG